MLQNHETCKRLFRSRVPTGTAEGAKIGKDCCAQEAINVVVIHILYL